MESKFRQTEIGHIPEDWTIGELKQVANFKNGRVSPERNDDEEYFVFGSNGRIGKSDKTNAVQGTTIIGRVGSYCGSVYYSKEKCWVTDNAIIAEAKENSDSLYLFYLLKRLNLHQHRGGSGQPLLNQTILNNLKVPIIDKPEQKSIGKILYDFDFKIELLQHQNQTLEAIGKTLFKHWFVDFEFPNDEEKPYKSSGGEMIEGELGEIPKGWEISLLGDYVDTISGCSYASKDLGESKNALVTLKSVGRRGNFQKAGFKEYFGEYKEQQVVEDGDIIVAHTDLTQKAEVLGRPAIVRDYGLYDKMIASLDLVVVRPKAPLSRSYTYHLLNTNDFHNHAFGFSNGTTVIHLSKKAIPKYEFPLPAEKNIKII